MEETSFVSLMIQSIGSLALVLAIFAGLVWGLRRMQQTVAPSKDGKMQVIQRLHLDSKNSVVEIKHGNQHYLLGVGQGGVQKISDFIPQVEGAVQSQTEEEVAEEDQGKADE